jgi:MFS family permease
LNGLVLGHTCHWLRLNTDMPMDQADHTPQRRVSGTVTALLFTACFTLSQADKQVMGLLAVPVQQTFSLSDTQLGLLQGATFALAFAIGGLPIAALLDRGHRVRIASACVALWSLATIACGLATSFFALAAFRAATAFAEAGLPPAAFSIFGQSGDRRLTARMSNTFMFAPFIGGGAILLLGGFLLKAVIDNHIAIPGFEQPWRMVFLAVGLPGLVLALLLLLAHEPKRKVRDTDAIKPPSFGSVFVTIFQTSGFMRHYFAALTVFAVLYFAVGAWYPAHLVRHFHIPLSSAGKYVGMIFLTAGVLGTFGARAWTTRQGGASPAQIANGYFRAIVMLIPIAIGLSTASDIRVSLGFYAAYAFLAAGIFSSMVVPIQITLNTAIFARGFAIFSLLTSAFAGTLGPLVVGIIADRASFSLGLSLAVTSGLATTVAAILMRFAKQSAQCDEDQFTASAISKSI